MLASLVAKWQHQHTFRRDQKSAAQQFAVAGDYPAEQEQGRNKQAAAQRLPACSIS
jgi:hypothetical protein